MLAHQGIDCDLECRYQSFQSFVRSTPHNHLRTSAFTNLNLTYHQFHPRPLSVGRVMRHHRLDLSLGLPEHVTLAAVRPFVVSIGLGVGMVDVRQERAATEARQRTTSRCSPTGRVGLINLQQAMNQ